MRRSSSFVFPQQQENDGLDGTQQSGQIGRNGNFQMQGPGMPRASPHWNAVQKDLNQLNSATENSTPASVYDAFSRSPLKRGQQKPNMTAFTSNAPSRPLLKRAQERPAYMVSTEKPVQMENKQLRPRPYWASVQEGINAAVMEESIFPAEHDLYPHPMLQIPQEDAYAMTPAETMHGRATPYWSAIEQHVNSALEESDFTGEEDPFCETTMFTVDEPDKETEEDVAPYLSPIEQKMASSIEESNFPKSLLSAYWVNTGDQTQKCRNIHAKKSEPNVKVAEVSALDKKFSKMSKAKKRNLFEKNVLGQIPSAKGEMVKPSSEDQEPSAKPFLQTGPSEDIKNELAKLSSLNKRDPFGKPILGKDPLLDSANAVATPPPPTGIRSSSAKKGKKKDTAEIATGKMKKPSPPKTEAEKLSTSIKSDPFTKPIFGKESVVDPTTEVTSPPSPWRFSDSFTKSAAEDASLNKRDPFARPVLGLSNEEPQVKVPSSEEPPKDKSNKKKEIAKLNNKIEVYEKELQRVKLQLEHATFEKEEYLQCITQLNDQAQKDGQLMDHLGYDNASLKRQVKEMENDLGLLMKADEELQSQAKALEDAQCKNKKLTLEMTGLRVVLEKYEKENATSVNKIKMITDLEAQTAMKNESLMLTEKMLMTSIEELEEEMKSLKAENDKVRKEVESLKTIKKTEEQTREENVMLKTRIDQLESDLRKKEEHEFKPSDSIMEALKKNEELKRRIAEIDKEKAEIKAANEKYTNRMEKLAEIDQKSKDESNSSDIKSKIKEVKADLEFVKQNSLLESKQDVDFQAKNEELKSKVRELEEKLRQSKLANKKFKSEKNVPGSAKTSENSSSNTIDINEVIKQLKKLHDIILDAKKELNYDSDALSIFRKSTSLSDNLLNGEKNQKANKTLEQDQKHEFDVLYKSLINTAEDLIEEIIKKRNKVGKFYSNDEKERDEISDLKDTVMHLEDDLSDERNKCKDLEKRLDKKDQLIKKLEKDVEGIESKQDEISNLKDRIMYLEDDLKDEKENCKDLKKRLSKNEQPSKTFQKDFEDMERNKCKDLEKRLDKKDQLIKKLEKDVEDIDKKQNEISNLKEQVLHLEHDLKDAKDKCKDTENHLEKKEMAHKKLQKDFEDIKNKLKTSITASGKQLDQLRDELKTKTGKVEELEGKLQTHKNQENEWNEALQTVRSEAAAKDIKVTDLKGYINELETENLRLLEEIEEQKRKNIKVQFSTNNQLQNEIKKLKEEINDLQAERNKLKQELKNVNTKELEAELAELKREKNMEMLKMVEHITVLQDEINDKERMLTKATDEASNDKKKYESDVHLLRKEIQCLQDAAVKNKKNIVENDNDLAVANATLVNSQEHLSKEMLNKIEMYDALSLQIRNENQMALDNNTEITSSLGIQIENTISFLENSNAELRNKLSNSESQLKKMMENKDVPDNNTKTERQNITEKQDPYVQYSRDTFKTNQDLERLKVSSKKLEEALEMTSTELKNIQVERSTLKKQLTDLKLNQSQLEMEMKHAVTLETSLKERNVMLKDEVESLEKELSDREAELNILKKSKETDPTVDSKNDKESSEEKIKDLTKENEMMYANEKQLQLYNKQLESVVVSSRSTVNEMKLKVTKLEVAEKTWEEKEKNFQNEIQTSAAKIKDLESKLSENMKALQSMQDQEKKETNVLETSNSKAGATKTDELTKQLRDVQSKLNEKKKLMQELQQQIATLTSDRNNSLKQLKQKSIQIAKLELTLNDKREVEKKLSDMVQALEKSDVETKEQFDKLKAEKFLLTKQLETIEKQPGNETTDSLVKIVELQQMIGDVLDEKAVMYEQEKQLKANIEKLEKINLSLTSEKESLENQFTKLKEESDASLQSSKDQLRKAMVVSEKGLKSLEEQIYKKNDELVKSKETSQIRLQCLEDQLKKANEGSEKALQSLQDQLCKKTDEIKDQKDKMSTQMQELESKAKISEEQLVLLKRKVSRLETDKTQWEQKEMRLEREGFSMLEKIDDLQNKLAKTTTSVKADDTDKSSVEVTASLKAKLTEIMDDKERLLEQIQKLNAQIRMHESNTVSSRGQIDDLERKLSKLQDNKVMWAQKEVRLEKEALTLGKKIESMQEKLEEQKTEVTEKEKQEVVSKESIAQLQESLKKLTAEKESLASQCADMKSSMQSRIKELKQTVSEHVASKELLREDNTEMQNMIDKLQKKVQSLSEKKEHQFESKESVAELQESLKKLTSEKDILAGQCADIKSSMQARIKELKQTVSEHVASKKLLREDHTEMQNTIDKLQKKVQSLTTQNEQLVLKEKRPDKHQTSKVVETSEKYTNTENEWKNQEKELEKQLHHLQERISLVHNEKKVLIAKYEEKTAVLENEIRGLKSRTSEDKEHIEKAKDTQNQPTKQHVSELESKIRLLQGQVESLTSDNDRLQAKIKQQQEAIEIHDKGVRDTVEQPRNICDTLESETRIKRLQDHVESLSYDNNKLKAKIKEQQETYGNKAQEVEEKVRQSQTTSDSSELASTIKRLQDQVESLTYDNNKLKAKMEEQQETYEKQVQDMEEKVAQPKTTLQLANKNKSLQDQVESLMYDNNKLKGKIKEQQEKVQEVEEKTMQPHITSDSSGFASKIKRLQDQVESLTNDNDKLKVKIKEQHETYEKVLEVEHKTIQPQTPSFSSELASKNKRLQDQIESLTSDNNKLNTKIKEQQETYEKKLLQVEHKTRQPQTTSDTSELASKIKLLQNQVESLKHDNDTLKVKIKEQQETYEKKVLEVELKTRQPQTTSDSSEFASKIERLQDQVESLTSDNNKLNTKIKEQQTVYGRKVQEVEEKARQPETNSELEIKIKRLQNQVESLTSDNNKLKVKIKEQQMPYENELEVEHKTRQFQTISDCSELDSKIKCLQDQIESLTSDNNKLKERIKQQQETYEKQVQDMEGKDAQPKTTSELESKIKLLQNQVESLKYDNNKLNTKIKEQQESYEKVMGVKHKTIQPQTTSDSSELESKIKRLQDQVESLTYDNNKLNTKIKEQQETYEKKLLQVEHKTMQPQTTSDTSELASKNKRLQDQVEYLTSDNNKLNAKIKKQQVPFEKVLEVEDEVRQSQTTSDSSELKNKIKRLQDQVESLTSDNETLKVKIKQHQEAFKMKALGLEDKVEQPVNATILTELEIKIAFLQGRVESLTSENDKLNAKLKKQQKIYKKKVFNLEAQISKQENNAEQSQTFAKKDDSLSRESESSTSVKDELLDLQERLQESKDSEKKLSNLLEHTKSKLSELNDAKDKLQKENDYLFKKVRDHKNDMMRYIEIDQDIQDKIVNMTEEISVMKSERRKFDQEMSSLIKELEARDDDEKQLSLGDEINIALRKSIESIEDDDDLFWGTNMKIIPEEDTNLHNSELVEDDSPLPSLHSLLQTLKSAIDVALQKTQDENQTTDEEPRAKKVIKKLEEKITRIEEENDFLQKQMQEVNARLLKVKTEAENKHERSLEIENDTETMVTSLKEKLTQVQNEKHCYETQVKELIASKDKLESSMEDKLSEVQRLKDRIASLVLQSEEYSKTTEQNTIVYNNSIIKLNEEIRKLEKDLKTKESITEELNNEVHRLGSELAIKEQRATEHIKAKKDLEQQIKSAQEKISLFEESKANAQNALDDIKLDKENTEKTLIGKLENAKQENKDLLVSKEELQRIVEGLREQLEKLEREKKEMLMEEKAKSNELKERLDIVMRELQESPNDDAKKLKAFMSRLSEELESKTKANKELKKNLENLQATIDRLQENNQSCTEESDNLIVTTRSTPRQSGLNLDELRLKQEVLRKNIEDLRRDVDRLDDPQKDIDDETRDQLRLLKYQVCAAQEQIQDLQRHLKYRAQKERSYIEELEAVKRDREHLSEGVSNAELEMIKLKMEIIASKNHVDDLQQQLDEKNSEIMRMCQHMVFSSMRSGPTFRSGHKNVSAGVSHNADFMARQARHGGPYY